MPSLAGAPGSTSSLSILPSPGTHRASPEIMQGDGTDWEPPEGRVFKSLQLQINSAAAEVRTKALAEAEFENSAAAAAVFSHSLLMTFLHGWIQAEGAYCRAHERAQFQHRGAEVRRTCPAQLNFLFLFHCCS